MARLVYCVKCEHRPVKSARFRRSSRDLWSELELAEEAKVKIPNCLA